MRGAATRVDTGGALLMPGQGSQKPGMGAMVREELPELHELALDAVGDDPFERAEESTRFAQPAIYCAALAAWRRAGSPRPAFMAGHSLGEVTALVAAGALGEVDGLRLVALRGELMERSGRGHGDGGMLAVIGGDRSTVARIARAHGLTVANDNAPGQLVLAGERATLAAAARDARAEGLRAIPLRVRGAFHSPAMAGAVPEFAAALDEVRFDEPRATVFSCVTAGPFDDVRRRLRESLTSPVRWRDVLVALAELGAERFAEPGPGRVLTKLVRRTLPRAEIVPASELEGVNA